VGKCSSIAKQQDSHVWLPARGCVCPDPEHGWVQRLLVAFPALDE